MLSKIYYCPYCEKDTRHIEKTMSEALGGSGAKHSRKLEILGSIMDGTGVSKVTKYALNQFYWRCTECGYGTCRKHNGDIDHLTYNL